MSIQSLTLRFTNPTQQVIGTQEISSTSNGQKSVPITDAGILAAFNANPEGTIFTPSIAANYGNDESGNPITSVTSPASNIPSFIPRPPPPPPISLAANGVTIQYTLPSIAIEPRFIQANPRGTGMEWFAVVTNASSNQIRNYALSTGSAISTYFTPSEQLDPVPFDNIVTTLMTSMAGIFNNVQAFNKDIGSWDTSNVTTMFYMFKEAKAFNQNIGNWDVSNVTNMYMMFRIGHAFNNGGDSSIGDWNTAKVTDMHSMFNEAYVFNQDISGWNTAIVTNMSVMFHTASVFNQNLSGWNVANVTKSAFFKTNSPLALPENSGNIPSFTTAANNTY